MSKAEDFIALGVITGAHGIKGAVKIKPFTEAPDGLLRYDLHDKNGKAFKLKHQGDAKGQLICAIEGIRCRNEAEKLKGIELGVPRAILPEPDADEFYIEDMIGMAVILEDGSSYGTVKAVHNYGAGDIVEITTPQGDTMLSMNEQTVIDVDIDHRTMQVSLPEIVKGQPS